MKEESSKTAKKKSIAKIAQMVDLLLKQKPEEIQSLPLPERVITEMIKTKKISSFSALRRQKKYLTRLFGDCDLSAVEKLQQQSQVDHYQNVKRFHDVETWRDKLIDENAITLFVQTYPQSHYETLANLVDDAKRARDDQKGPKRKLFRYIESILAQN